MGSQEQWKDIVFRDPYFANMVFASYVYHRAEDAMSDKAFAKKVRESTSVGDLEFRASILAKLANVYESPLTFKPKMGTEGGYRVIREEIERLCGPDRTAIAFGLAAFSNKTERIENFAKKGIQRLKTAFETHGHMQCENPKRDPLALLFRKELERADSDPDRPPAIIITVLFSDQSRITSWHEVSAAASLKTQPLVDAPKGTKSWSILVAPVFTPSVIASAGPLGDKVTLIDPFGMLVLLHFFDQTAGNFDNVIANIRYIFDPYVGFFPAVDSIDNLTKHMQGIE